MTLPQFRLYLAAADRAAGQALKRAILATRAAQIKDQAFRELLDRLPD